MTRDVPTREELWATAERVAAQIAPRADECDALRHVHPESVAAMRDAGLFRAVQPARIGGDEKGITDLHGIAHRLARGCPSSSWIFTVLLAHTWVLGMFPEETQDEISADDPDTLIAGTLASQGKADPVEGGFRIHGQWQFASGCDHARWGLFCAALTTSSADAPKHVHVMVPKDDFRIVDTWRAMGLRGTGSHDVAMDDVFVPTHRTMSTGVLFSGRSEYARKHKSGVFLQPLLPSLSFGLTAPVMGLAETALELFVERTKGRVNVYDGSSKARTGGIQMRIAEASAEIECAHHLTHALGRRLDAIAESRAATDIDTRVDIKWKAAYAIEICRRAVDRIFAVAGANAIYDVSPLQRIFQSINTASHHQAADYDGAATSFGRMALGLGPGTVSL